MTPLQVITGYKTCFAHHSFIFQLRQTEVFDVRSIFHGSRIRRNSQTPACVMCQTKEGPQGRFPVTRRRGERTMSLIPFAIAHLPQYTLFVFYCGRG